jgi:Reverse transcriptase (RNA-dependent DNA polymerase)
VKMLSKHSSVWTGSLGEISITEHHIQLQSDAKPVYQPPYRAGVKAREVEKAEVDRMLTAGVIEPAVSEWASPVVLITKPDGSVRFCVDYRKLNALTIKDSYPLPRMDECLDSLGDATIFSTLDCNSGYWQILMKEEDRNKTAFVTHCGIHRFKRMPFGLCNAPATFQRALDMILAKVKWNYALIYLDDVIIYSRTVEEHMTHLDEVLGLLRSAGASLKLRNVISFKQR